MVTKNQRKTAWQRLFETFLYRVDGKGRATSPNGNHCVYVPEDGHPGCAVGCQPAIADNPEMRGMVRIRESKSPVFVRGLIREMPELGELLFGYRPEEEDVLFASDLQILHDASTNWENNNLLPESVRRFALAHNLVTPEKYNE